MKISPIPENEKERLAALQRYHILDTEAEKDFNDIVDLAAQLCEVPISAISLIDEHRQWFKAITGGDREDTQRDLSFCAHAILQKDMMVVSDTLKDDRFFDNPLVTGDPNIRFYAGTPLITDDGYTLGTLCVIDRKPRNLNAHQLNYLRILAKKVVTLFDLRFNISQLKETIQKNSHLVNLVEQSRDAIISVDGIGLVKYWNQGAEILFGFTTEEAFGKPLKEMLQSQLTDEKILTISKAIKEKQVWRDEVVLINKNGVALHVQASVSPIMDGNDNKVSGFGLQFWDLSEKKKIEDELKRSNHFLDTVLEHIPNKVFIKDARELRFVRVNEAFAMQLGCRQEELVGKTDYDFFPIEQADFFTSKDREALASETMVDVPEEPNTIKGETRFMHTKKIRITDKNNTPLYLLGIAEDITERKILEDQLKRFNEELKKQVEEKTAEVRDTFERISDSFIALDKNWCYTYLNKKAEMMSGRPPGTLLGKNIWKEFPAVAEHPLKTICEEAMATQQLRYMLDYYPEIDRWIENHIHPSPTGLSIYGHDITEKKKAEIAVRQSDDIRKRIMDSAMDAIICIDTKGDITFWNPQAEKIFGWKEVDMMGRHLADTIIPEQYRQQHVHGLKHYLNTGEGALLNKVIEITAINRNGKEFPIELTIAAVKQNGSEFFCAFIRDITERKKAESEVRNSEERYRSIFENALDGIFQSTPEGEFITVNPAMAKIFGYESPHEMISSITDIGSGVCVNPQDRFHIIDLQREHGQPVNFELRAKKKNQELIWVRANLHAVKDDGGKVQYLEGIMEDITERKKAEEQIVKEKELSGFIINSLPGVFYLYDENGKFLRWNKNLETVSGYTGDEISRMHPLDFFDEDEKEILTERIGKVFTEGMGEVEAHFFTKDRRKILYYFNGWRTKFEERVCLIGMGIDITARKNAEQKIIEEKELSDSIINSLPGIFYLFDINQNFLRWNKNFEIVSGYSAEELKPMHALNFFDVDEQELAKETILRSLTIGLGEMDAHFLTKDRKKIPYHFIGQPSYFEGLPCMLGVGIDISERKKAEENTRHAVELYRNIFEHSLAGIYQNSPDGKFITVNPTMAKIFGYDNPTEFITSITDMGTQLYANPNDREQLRSQVAMNGFVNGFELRLLKKTKEIIWVRVNELMVNDKEGKTLYFDGTLEDITELKASEESLEKSVSLLRATLESTADGILVVDANGKIVGFNKKAEELWRFPEHLLASGSDDKALAFAIDQLINPESFISKVKELYSKPEAISFDLLEFKDGRIFERYSQPQLLYEKSVGRVWSFRDITKRAMDEKKLVIQFEELQKVNSELDHFVYSVSHDLRAPLSSILGILNIADLENPEATQKKYLGMIRKSISRLDGFIKDILDYSGNTRKEVQSEKIDFLEIMREVQSNLSHMNGMDRVKITIEINDTVPFYADRIRMEIIMNNLLSNSIKYCDRTKESSVFTMSVSTSVEKASIKISDNGIGIKEEHMDKVFNMFYRASETSTGSGLGLYITRETISKLGGTIKVKSEFGQYTAFDIIIPNLKVSAKS